jgi:hypothetical protein
MRRTGTLHEFHRLARDRRMNDFNRARRPTAVLVVPFSLLPSALRAQGRAPTVGVVGGTTRPQQIWGRSPDAGPADVLLLGAWVGAPTPSTWFSVRAEGAFTQRGGDVTSVRSRGYPVGLSDDRCPGPGPASSRTAQPPLRCRADSRQTAALPAGADVDPGPRERGPDCIWVESRSWCRRAGY